MPDLAGVPRRPRRQGIVALVAAAREADLHKAFTDTSVLKASYYLKSAAPSFEEGVECLLPILFIVVLLQYRHQHLVDRAPTTARGAGLS